MHDYFGGYARSRLLMVLCGLSSWPVETPFLQLHTSDPGADGVAAAAMGRKPLMFGDPVGGVARNSDEMLWPSGEVVSDGSFSHFTVWSQRVGGEFLWSGRLSASFVSAGDEFRIPAGALSVIIEEPA